MAYISLQNFRYGLDARRSVLNSQPGTLQSAFNVHINQGGEIEKRQRFVKIVLPVSTFGLLTLSDAVYVFGSRDFVTNIHLKQITNVQRTSNVATITMTGHAFLVGDPFFVVGITVATGFNGTGFIVTAVTTNTISYANAGVDVVSTPQSSGLRYGNLQLPNAASVGGNGVVVQRLQNGSANMTKVVHACAYNDKAFVIADFDDGTRQVFYDSVIVKDWTAGLVTAALAGNNVAIEAAIGGLVNDTEGYTYTAGVITGINGSTYSATSTLTTAAGTVGLVQNNIGIPGTAAFQPIGSFLIVAQNSFGTISDVLVDGTSLFPNPISSITVGTDTVRTAARIAREINKQSTASGYTAMAKKNVVSLVSNTAGTTFNGKAVSVVANQVMIGNFSFNVIASSGTFTITHIKVAGVDVNSGTYTYPGAYNNLGELYAAIATDIQTTASATYTSVTDSANVYISKLTTSSADGNLLVTFTTTGTVTIAANGQTITSLGATALPSTIFTSDNSPVSPVKAATQYVTISVAGGTAPYTYQWSQVDQTLGFYCVSPTEFRTSFVYGLATGNASSIWICTVKDANGNTAISNQVAIVVNRANVIR